MYEYKFIKLDLNGFLQLKPKQDYHEIIEDHAKEGRRLVQVLTRPTGSYGAATHYELIFEKERE